MFNFRFIKQQAKILIIPALILFVVLSMFTVLFVSISDSLIGEEVVKKTRNGGEMNATSTSVIVYNSYSLYLGLYFIFTFVFSIILVHKLIIKEVHEGYMASWLTLPISRKTMLNSKFLLIIATILIINFSNLFLQLILYASKFNDSTIVAQLYIVFDNFVKLLLWILWTAIVWFIACIFSKSSTYMTISYFLAGFFIFCFFMTYSHRYENGSATSISWDDMTLMNKLSAVLRYLSITSLYNRMIKSEMPEVILDKNANTYDIVTILKAQPNKSLPHVLMPIKASDFAWQIPTMIGASAGLFPYGNYQFIRKDLAL